MTTQVLTEVLQRVESLPRLPDSSLRLLKVLSEPNSTIAEIVESIRYDQTVTADLLRMCNSSHYGLSRQIASVDQAISLLGTAKVLQLVMAAHTQAMFSKPQEGYGLRPGALWIHSVAVALGCQIFAKQWGLAEVGLVFTAGLMHDIGKVVLNEYVASEYAEIARRVADEGISFLEGEQQVLGFTHPDIGAHIANQWGLPEPIVRCIRYHHEPESLSKPDPLVDVVHLADAVCLVLAIGGGDDGLLYRAHPAVMERHNVTEPNLENVGADIILELKSVQQDFNVN